MALTAGTRIGAYEITALIGTGGMGDVYRARDLTLPREVALKVVREPFVADPERVERFKREAHILASLNHPNIASIYGFVEGQALVMEFVDGPMLADRIAEGALPLEEALPIARQIADALQSAHDQGIVHRDLKPANIKVRPDGTVKVLDFGLAKAFHGEGAVVAAVSTALTIGAVTTEPGVILGTAAYMSPEQARGKPVDRRTDLWAFGCVLYEMLTGRPVFQGQELTDILASVVTKEPDWPALPANTPAPVGRVLRRCLKKERTARLDSGSDAGLEIEDALVSQIDEGQRSHKPFTRVPATVSWLLVAASVIALAVIGSRFFSEARNEPSNVRFFVNAPNNWTLPAGAIEASAPLSVAPDGRRLAYVAINNAGRSQVWLQSFGDLDPQAIGGTEGGHSPFWSPDSQTLAFFADGQLKRVDITGGPVTKIGDIDGRGGSWSPNGVILVNPSLNSPLMRIPASGGQPTAATKLAPGELDHRQPDFLPDGRHFLFVAGAGVIESRVYVGVLDSTDVIEVPLVVDSSEVAFSAGYLMFIRDTTLMAQPFDVDRLETVGAAIPITNQLHISTAASGTGVYASFATSPGGVLVYRTGVGFLGSELSWFDSSGNRTDTVASAARLDHVALSPDGNRAVASLPNRSNTRDLWMFDLVRNLRTRFTFDAEEDTNPVWSPDSMNVAFRSTRRNRLAGDLYLRPASGVGQDTVLLEDNLSKIPTSWSPDGRWLLYYTGIGGENRVNQLFVLPLAGDHTPKAFLPGPFSRRGGQFSPDGKWVAYTSLESGRPEVYVTSFPDQHGKWQVSADGGDTARWHPVGSPGTELEFAL